MTRSILNGTHFHQREIEATRERLREEIGAEPSEYRLVHAMSEDFRLKAGLRTPAGAVMPHKLDTPNFDMWGALSHHFEAVQAQPIPKVIVDGTVLCADPESVMHQVTRKLLLPYDPHMLSGWEHAGGKKLIPSLAIDDLKDDAWLVDAVKSHGIIPPKNQPLPLRKFSPSVQRYVAKSLEFFQDFANDPHAALPRTPEKAERLFTMHVTEGAPFGTNLPYSKGATFETAQPIITYAIVSSMPAHDQAERTWKNEKLAELEKLHEKSYGDSFHIMKSRQNVINGARLAGLRQ